MYMVQVVGDILSGFEGPYPEAEALDVAKRRAGQHRAPWAVYKLVQTHHIKPGMPIVEAL